MQYAGSVLLSHFIIYTSLINAQKRRGYGKRFPCDLIDTNLRPSSLHVCVIVFSVILLLRNMGDGAGGKMPARLTPSALKRLGDRLPLSPALRQKYVQSAIYPSSDRWFRQIC